MTSVAKDCRHLIRFNHNQNHSKHHIPGIIMNYLFFIVLLRKVEKYSDIIFIFICYVIIFYLFLYFIRLYLVYGVCYDFGYG